MLTTTDPRTGEVSATALSETDAAGVDLAVTAATEAFPRFRDAPRRWRVDLLRAIADRLRDSRDDLLAAALSETGLGEQRLTAELTRTTDQLELFASAVDEGGYLEATIDTARAEPVPTPEIRRMLVPIGPVAVFGASNFPFAFSVPGGDTVSALAAGNPVVVKAHGSHPRTSQRAFDAILAAATDAGAPDGVIGLVHGVEAGADLVRDDRIAAVAFTGSLSGGRALMQIMTERSRPAPFYGEMSSVNPVVISTGAATEDPEGIAAGIFGSVTGSAGQLCTKPGVVFLPRSADEVVRRLASLAGAAEPQPLLNQAIFDSYLAHAPAMTEVGVETLVEPRAADHGLSVTPTVHQVDAADLTGAIAGECFGPSVVLVRYDGPSELLRALRAIPGSLAASVFALPEERAGLLPVIRHLEEHSGRLVFGGHPTGVRVSLGQHHGGPWPATNTLHTSVGVSAMRRFLRPFAWQDAPSELLPEELRDAASVPRRVDGRHIRTGETR